MYYSTHVAKTLFWRFQQRIGVKETSEIHPYRLAKRYFHMITTFAKYSTSFPAVAQIVYATTVPVIRKMANNNRKRIDVSGYGV